MSQMDLKGKRAVVLGVADRESLAWSIARTFARSGAEVTIGYQRKFHSRVRKLLEEEPTIRAKTCDILDLDELEEFFSGMKADALVHSIAYGPEAVFSSPPSEVSARDFNETLEISAHSLAKVVRAARGALVPGASVVTLSFQASARAMPMYGMMGVAKSALESLVRYLAVELGRDRIRVNAISAGPVETLAALSEIIALRRNPAALDRMPGTMIREAIAAEFSGTSADTDELELARRCWKRIQGEFAKRSPIPEILTAQDVADSAAFLVSDGSKRLTGQVLHVDCGFSSCLML